MTTVAIYLRRSSVSADRPGDVSHAEQEARCRALAAEHGDPDPIVLEDWGKSGGHGKEAKRPAFLRLRELIGSGSVQWVVAYDLSRLSRSTRTILDLVEHADANGCALHVGDLGVISSRHAAGELTLTMLGAVATYHRNASRDRRLEQVAAIRARGGRLGRKSYGMAPGEDLPAVLAAFDRTGSYNRAARDLNGSGVVPPRYAGSTGLWRAVAVRRIVVRERGLDPSARKGVRSRTDHLLSGLVRCHCGGMMTTLSPSRPGTGERLYCGRTRVVTGHGRAMVNVSALLPALRTEVARLAPILPERVDLETAETSERAALEAKRERLALLYADGDIDRATYLDRRAAVDASLRSLAAAERIADVPSIDLDNPDVAEANAQLRTVWRVVQLDAEMHVEHVEWTLEESLLAA